VISLDARPVEKRPRMMSTTSSVGQLYLHDSFRSVVKRRSSSHELILSDERIERLIEL
jgi:hypothetical protein